MKMRMKTTTPGRGGKAEGHPEGTRQEAEWEPQRAQAAVELELAAEMELGQAWPAQAAAGSQPERPQAARAAMEMEPAQAQAVPAASQLEQA